MARRFRVNPRADARAFARTANNVKSVNINFRARGGVRF